MSDVYVPRVLRRMNRLRKRAPFWWWIAYDIAVAFVIVTGVEIFSVAFWIGFGTLAVAVFIDAVEFIAKSPWGRARRWDG